MCLTQWPLRVCASISGFEEGKKKPHTNHYVSLYLYYIIKFNVVPETNHTGWTDIPARPQHTVPAKREKRQRKAQRVLKLRKGHRTWWSGEEKVQKDEHVDNEKTGGDDWVGHVKRKETGKLLTEWRMKTERHECRKMTRRQTQKGTSRKSRYFHWHFLLIYIFFTLDEWRMRSRRRGQHEREWGILLPWEWGVIAKLIFFFLLFIPKIKKAQTHFELNYKMELEQSVTRTWSKHTK